MQESYGVGEEIILEISIASRHLPAQFSQPLQHHLSRMSRTLSYRNPSFNPHQNMHKRDRVRFLVMTSSLDGAFLGRKTLPTWGVAKFPSA